MIHISSQTIDNIIAAKKATVIALLDEIKIYYLEYEAAKFARNEEAIVLIEQLLEQAINNASSKLKLFNKEIALLEAFKPEFEQNLDYYARQLDDLLNSIEPLIPPSFYSDASGNETSPPDDSYQP